MARLPALIDSFVSIDGRDRPTIEHVARVIREHGFIPTTKRGTGAAVMTSREAVNLLFALNGAFSPKECVAAVERLRLLSRFTPAHGDHPAFYGLRNITALGDALAYLIDNYPSILKFFGVSLDRIDEFFFDRFEIGVEIHRARARLVIKSRGDSECSFSATYRLSTADADRLLHESFDRRVVTYLSERTIHTLWHCVCGGLASERG